MALLVTAHSIRLRCILCLARMLIVTADGTDTSKLTEVKQFYNQNGRTIEHPMYSLNGNRHNVLVCEAMRESLFRYDFSKLV